MSDAYRAGKYHAETDQPSNLAFYTPHTFAWFDYLEGQSTGFNERFWDYKRSNQGAATIAAMYERKRDEVKAILKAAGR